MDFLLKVRLFFLVFSILAVLVAPAYSFIGENKPRNDNLSSVNKTTSPESSANKSNTQINNQPSEINSTSTNNKDNDGTRLTPRPSSKITLKIEKIEQQEPTNEDLPKTFSDTLQDIQNNIDSNSFYQFTSTTPENDFITLSALDVVLTDVEHSLLGTDKDINRTTQPKCDGQLADCNARLYDDLSKLLDEIQFIKNTEQALGNSSSAPEIQLQPELLLTNLEIEQAFQQPLVQQQIPEFIINPDELANAIRKTLKDKENIFSDVDSNFQKDLILLRSSLSPEQTSFSSSAPNSNQTTYQTRKSNLTSELAEKTLDKIDELIQFINSNKLVVNNKIITSNNTSPLTPQQAFDEIYQQASKLTSLFDLMTNFLLEETEKAAEEVHISEAILPWYENYKDLITDIDTIYFNDAQLTEESLALLSLTQDRLRNSAQQAIIISNNLLNSKQGLQTFKNELVEISELNLLLKEEQDKILFSDLDLIMLETEEILNQLLLLLSAQNLNELGQPINNNTLTFFSDLIPENVAMKELMNFILSEKPNLLQPSEYGLADIGFSNTIDGFFKYQEGYVSLNGTEPRNQALQMLEQFNYISATY